jgi:2'-hydroxyisoflavone reductase
MEVVMELLILGGTRFLGRYLVESAQKRDHSVTLFNRGQGNPDLFPDVETLIGDRNGNLEALKHRSWDTVIDTCGFVPRAVKQSAELLSDSVGHYTFISSGSVYTELSRTGIDEDHSVATLSNEQAEEITKGSAGPFYNEHYGALKYLCEQTLEELMPNRAAMIRSGLIVGPHDYTDRFTYWVSKASKGGEVLAPGNPDRQIQFIDVRDLSSWLIRMAEDKVTGVYNATGPDYSLTMGHFLEECKTACGSDADFTWVSEEFLHENQVAFWSEMPIWIPNSLNESGFLAVSVRKAINEGLTFRPLAETVKYTLEWESLRSPDVERKAGMKPQRESGLLNLWRSR